LTDRTRESSLRLIGRIYWPRIIGLGFAFLAVSYFLVQESASIVVWCLLVLWGLIWPHLAHVAARRASDPLKFEVRNLFVDAFMIGFWVPLMTFNIVPSIAILSMHLLSIVSVMGLRACLLGLLVELSGVALATVLFTPEIKLESQLPHLLVSLPMLVLYPLFVGFNAYSLSLKLAAKQAVLRKLSRTDGLTGLNNRMYWDEQVKRTFALNKRSGATASIVFLDADHFKAVNDQYGHGVGDDVLRRLAELIRDCARETDVCCRYGGEEFCLLLPDTDTRDAEILAERLRQLVAAEVLHQEHDIRGSISLGVAQLTAEMGTYNAWLDQADKALYQAKQRGRNRTVCAESLAELSAETA
jgi:diguanylate cyclase